MPEPENANAENQSTGQDAEEIRAAIATSGSGAPAAGEVVRDIFTTDEIFQRILASADEEFCVSKRLLFLSGLAAGLTMSLSFLGPASIAGALPGEPVALSYGLLYPLGFIFVILGRYQLFTENTLTPVTLVMTRIASIPRLLSIWGIVFSANVLGTAIAAFFFAKTAVFSPEVETAAVEIAKKMVELPWWETFSRGILAGWLVAGMVWLNHAARSAMARLLIIFVLMYTVAAAELAHCIVGSTEVLYLLVKGEATAVSALWGFLAPATLGNVAGGVLLVALLNYGQTQEEHRKAGPHLSWRDWLLGHEHARWDAGE